MENYEKTLISQFKKQDSIIINTNKVDVLYMLEQKLRKVSKCTFAKYSENQVICKKVSKIRPHENMPCNI